VNLKKSISRKGFIFKATFTQDTPAGTECLVRYGYNPSWDFVKGYQLPCVPDSNWQDEPDGSKEAAEEKQESSDEEEAPEAPKQKKAKKDKGTRRKKAQVPEIANQVD
jgi:hypothetical protein